MKTLRPYQIESINAIKNELDEGIKSTLLCLSMGLGKTFTAIKTAEKLGFKKILWITDDERLLEQSAIAFIRDKFNNQFADRIEDAGFLNYVKQGGNFDGYKFGVIKQELFNTDCDVCFASGQTLWRRLDKLTPEMFDLVIVDEAHCFGGKMMFQSVDFWKPTLKLGLTATPKRLDGMLMGDLFDTIAFEYGMREGIRDGYLCEMDAIRIKTNTNLDKIHLQNGDFNQNELSNEINTPARNNQIAQAWLKYAKGRQTIGYGCDINHCIALAEAFKMYGINAEAISSDEERTGDKSIKIKNYKKGKVDVLWNVNLMGKGFDHPDTGCTISAAPTTSLVRYLQGPAGRGGRLKSHEFVAKFGQNCLLLDIVDNTKKHNLINAWELDRRKPLDERVFISSEKRQLLEAERNKKSLLTHIQDKDELVSLLSLPIIKLKKNIKMDNSAVSPAHLAQIAKWGYDVENTHYTKEMVKEIYLNRPAEQKIVNLLKTKGYDVSSGVTIGQAQLILQTIKK